MDTACFEQSLLEFWPQDFDFGTLSTEKEILEAVLRPNAMSSFYNTPINVKDYLGGISEDGQGRLQAQATFMRWFGRVNTSIIDGEEVSQSGTTGTESLDTRQEIYFSLMDYPLFNSL